MLDRIGDCRIIGEIGSGGMAVIYKAVQEPLERIVAVKALKPSIAIDSHFALRFEREARFMASLQHENIIHVYDFVKAIDTMYIIMEYVRGIDLYDLLDEVSYLPPEIAAIIGLQVARALDYAHFRGLVHRDIKPANIIVSYQGEVKLMDFGIARDEAVGGDLTETGTGVGTPSYMSPEQILGDKLDFRSDIFSLGIVLYQCMTGRKPFMEDESRSVMQKIRLERYTPPSKLVPQIPGRLERILARCMEKASINRYPATQALIDDLMEYVASRVPINHNARLVMYLRDAGLIEQKEAELILAASVSRSVHRSVGDRSMLRGALVIYGLLFLAVFASGGAIQASNGRFSGKRDDFNAVSGKPVIPADAGFLKVVVDPWADVYVDGQFVVTTPTANPIPLSPGKHYVNLKNPYYLDQKTEVTIRLKKTSTVDIHLRPDPQLQGRTTEASEP